MAKFYITDTNYLKYDRYSLVSISQLIVDAIKHYQDHLLTNEDVINSQEDAIKFAVGQVERLTKGTFNPSLVVQMAHLERKVWLKGTLLQC